MRIPSKMPRRVLRIVVILGLFLSGIIYLFWSWLRSSAVVTATLGRQFSPDSQWEAILEEVDNGLGFGLGATFQAIYLHKSHTSIDKHPNGIHDDAIVFYIDSEQLETNIPKFHWVNSRHLAIDYKNTHNPGKIDYRFNDIFIEYRVFDSESGQFIPEPWSDSGANIYFQRGPIWSSATM